METMVCGRAMRLHACKAICDNGQSVIVCVLCERIASAADCIKLWLLCDNIANQTAENTKCAALILLQIAANLWQPNCFLDIRKQLIFADEFKTEVGL